MTTPSAHRGRPRTAALLALADVFAVIADRLEGEYPITCEDVATDLAISRRSLARLVAFHTGMAWEPFILPFTRTSTAADVDDVDMKRITISLDDATFKSLRKVALDELRDPRLEARRILERSLAERAEAERRLDLAESAQ